MGQVRGASIMGTLRYVRERFGEDAPQRVLEATPLTQREAIADGDLLLESGWYDYLVLSHITRVADRLFGRGDLQLAREIGRAQAFTDVGRFFKWLLRLAGPKAIFGRATSVWRNYHDCGVFVVEEIGDHRAVFRIEDWSSADEIICRRVEGWMERGFELTVGTTPSIREVQHLDDDAAVSPHRFCRFVAEWS